VTQLALFDTEELARAARGTIEARARSCRLAVAPGPELVDRHARSDRGVAPVIMMMMQDDVTATLAVMGARA